MSRRVMQLRQMTFGGAMEQRRRQDFMGVARVGKMISESTGELKDGSVQI